MIRKTSRVSLNLRIELTQNKYSEFTETFDINRKLLNSIGS